MTQMPFGRTYPKSLAGLSRKNPSAQDNLDFIEQPSLPLG